MGKRDHKARKQARKLRNAEARIREVEEQRARPSIPMRNRTLCFRARGGVELSFNIEAQPVQGTGEPLTPDEARARLFDRAFDKGTTRE